MYYWLTACTSILQWAIFSLLNSKTCSWSELNCSFPPRYFSLSNSHLLSLFAPLDISQRCKCAFGNEMKSHVLSAWWDAMEFTAKLWKLPQSTLHLLLFFFSLGVSQVLYICQISVSVKKFLDKLFTLPFVISVWFVIFTQLQSVVTARPAVITLWLSV